MAIVEMEFDPGRRDFLTLGFARRKSRDGQPPRRSTSRSSSPQSQPPDGGFKVTRRKVLIASTLFTGSALAAALFKPWEWFNLPSEQFVVPELKGLGDELVNWQIDGTKVIDVFPEAKKAADILTGKIDPRSFLPTMKLPILFNPSAPDASFILKLAENTNDSRSLLVTLPSGQTQSLPWVSNQSEATIALSPEISASTARSAILIKEISQLYDQYDYCQLYLSLVQKAGVKIDVINPDNLPISDLEKVIITAHRLRILEERIYQRPSFLRNIVDSGSGLKTGIIFANWLLDQLNRKIPVPNPEAVRWVRTGTNLLGFLQEKGLIYQPSRGELFLWTKGASPDISSNEFLELLREFTNHPGNVFS